MVATIFFRWEITPEDMKDIHWENMDECEFIEYVVIFDTAREIEVFEKTKFFENEEPSTWNVGKFKGVSGFPVVIWTARQDDIHMSVRSSTASFVGSDYIPVVVA